jgi:hypothetical protein
MTERKKTSPNRSRIVLNRGKSKLIAFGVPPSRPAQPDFAPCHRLSGRSATSRRRIPIRQSIQPDRAKSYPIVVHPPLPSGRSNSASWDEILRVVAILLLQMLYLGEISNLWL